MFDFFLASKELLIRLARSEDAPALRTLLGQLDYTISEDEVAANLTRLGPGNGDCVLVAEHQKEVVGMITVHIIPLLHRPPLGRITSLIVKDSHRGKGTGKALVQAAEDFAFERGCSRVEVTSRDYRDSAHAFYQHLDYACDERRFIKQLGQAPTATLN